MAEKATVTSVIRLEELRELKAYCEAKDRTVSYVLRQALLRFLGDVKEQKEQPHGQAHHHQVQ